MDLVLPGESSARMKAVRRTRQILFLILPRRAERLKETGPQFLAFEQSVVDIRRLQNFLVSLAWRRSTNHTKKIEGEVKLLLEKELNRASRVVKDCKFSCYMLPVKVLLLQKIDPSLISIRINI